jgi:hypothetical protein
MGGLWWERDWRVRMSQKDGELRRITEMGADESMSTKVEISQVGV